jgi:hypothetical protein
MTHPPRRGATEELLEMLQLSEFFLNFVLFVGDADGHGNVGASRARFVFPWG